MRVPILSQRGYLIVSIQAALSDADWSELNSDLARQVSTRRSRAVIVDISAVDVMDSFATRTLRTMAQVTKLRGAETIVVGMQPDVAFSMVQLGLGLDGITTALDLEEGLSILDRAGRAGRGGH